MNAPTVRSGFQSGQSASKPAQLFMYVEDARAQYRRALEAGGRP